jgi:hypothetical protein
VDFYSAPLPLAAPTKAQSGLGPARQKCEAGETSLYRLYRVVEIHRLLHSLCVGV